MVLSLSGELELSLTDLEEVFASLNESLILSEDGIVLIQVPSWFGRVLFDHDLVVETDLLPLLAAVDALLEISHALLDIAVKHVFLADPCAATLDDLVADFGQETLHALGGVVVFGKLPDDSDTVKGLWKNFWNVFGF